MSASSQQTFKVSSIVTTTYSDVISTAHGTSTTVISIRTDSNGCVICEGTVSCPDCADDEYCIMTSLTCNSCPYTYCVPRSNSTVNGVLANSTSGNGTTGSNSSNINKNSTSHYATIHKIQGTVIGSVIGFVCIMLTIWYTFYWKKKKRLAKARELAGKTYNANDVDGLELDDMNEDNMYDSDDDDLDAFDEDTTNEIGSNNNNNNNNNNNTWNSNINRNHNGNTVTPFQQLQYINEIRSIKHPNIKNDKNNLSISIGDRTSSASNILPIGYIPGVTNTSTMNSGMMKNQNPPKNTNSKSNLSTYNNHLNIVGDIRSHITLGSSILEESSEDMDDNSNAYIKTLRPPLDTSNIMKGSTGSSLTTAIKGRPKLVQINDSKEMEGFQEENTGNESIKGSNQNSSNSNNNITNDRYSMRSDLTGTGSYILDFEINPLETRLQPPIPAANQNNIINRLSTINNLKRSSQVNTPLRNNRSSIDDSENISIATSDIITIDTKAVESSVEKNSINQQEQGSNPFGDEHEIA